MVTKRVINFLLRISIIISKTLLIYILTKYLTEADFGSYVLFTSILAFITYTAGLDLYIITGRKIITRKNDKNRRLFWIVLQLKFSFLTAITVSLGAYLLSSNLAVSQSVGILLVLIFSELVSQEVCRILINLERQIESSIIMFIRTSLWVFPLAIASSFNLIEFKLDLIFNLWTLFSVISLIVSVKYLGFSRQEWRYSIPTKKRDIYVLLRVLNQSRKYFLNTLTYRSIFLIDRYLLGYFKGVLIVGVYGFLSAIHTAVQVLVDSIFFQFYYPKLVGLVSEKKMHLSDRLHRNGMLVITLLYGMPGFFLVYSFDFIIAVVEKDNWVEYRGSLVLIFISGYIFSISQLFHYYNYALKQDAANNRSGYISYLIYLTSVFSWVYFDGGINEIILCYLAYCTALLILKSSHFYKIKKNA